MTEPSSHSSSLLLAALFGLCSACSSGEFDARSDALDSGAPPLDGSSGTGGASQGNGGRTSAGGRPTVGTGGRGSGGDSAGAGGSSVSSGGQAATGGGAGTDGGTGTGGSTGADGGTGTGGSTGNGACGLPITPGPCRGAIPSFGFNAVEGRCVPFIYGGCGGNENRFATEIECQATCVCTLPTVSGPCAAYMPSFGYDPSTGKCEEFVYGGCGGNENRFATESICETVCIERDLCLLPEDSGDCDGAFPRYRFDSRSGTCGLFSYGGCGGNDNNFATESDCLAACGRLN